MARTSRHRNPETGVSGEPPKRCFRFLKQGTCKFGSRCRYLHESKQSEASRQPHGHDSPRSEGKMREWQRLLKQSEQSSCRPSASTLSRFFQLGLELMDGDVAASQEAIKLLVTEAGLSLIKDVAERHIPAQGDVSSGLNLWAAGIKPLFQLVTHPRVVDSAVLEQEIAMIFNYLLGVSGSRMARLFTYIVQLLQAWPASSSTDISRIETVELCLAVLSKILDCNTTNIVNDSFSDFACSFAKILEDQPQPGDEFSHLQARKYLDYIQRRLEVGNEIAVFQSLPRIATSREHFVLRRDLPGHLSADGPRHDNDHAEIPKIKILPTYEEILSPRGEYLPTNDSSQWHIQGIRGRLDREFRLVREDTVGQLRDAVRETLDHIRRPRDEQSRRLKNSLRTYTYESPTPTNTDFDRNEGLILVVRCDQPSAVQKLDSVQRKDWWLQTKRLQAGALVCILDATGSVLFCVVSNLTMRNKDEKDGKDERKHQTAQPVGQREEPGTATPENILTLSDDRDFLHVKLQLIDPERCDIDQSLLWYRNVGSSARRYLVEFPGVLLDSFKHTLVALQQMYKRPDIPFSNLIAPSEGSSQVEMKPPLYTRQSGFTFDLGCLTGEERELEFAQKSPGPEDLASRTTLDMTQSEALLNTLSREMSLIQGPPGTGKSYTGEQIIKVLLANKTKANIGPILCVCYTNHALDQLLEHLLDGQVKGIIRIGSRSKSDRLQGLNLRAVAKASNRTKSEKTSNYKSEETLRDIVKQIDVLLDQLSRFDSWGVVKSFLAQTYPKWHDQAFGKTDDEWETAVHKPDVLKRWRVGGSRDDVQSRSWDALKDVPLVDMSHSERRMVYCHWLRGIRDPIIQHISDLHGQYAEALEQRNRVRSDIDLRCLQGADIVGVTTTGLARNLDLLRRLRCKVMLCEEAGEVPEAHILTALLPSVEHAILIGDHLQLRPQIQNYELQSTNPRGMQYSLDMSMFERLVQPPHETDARMPYSILETQRRMHPSIAELVRSTLYPALQDAEIVKDYPNVVGLRQRLFWLHHEHLEAGAASHDPLNTSHSNDFEIEMVTALVSHLVRQGKYAQGDIAVLTPYLGQMHKLRRRMESMFEICVNDRDLAELEELEGLEAKSGTPTAPSKPPVSKSTLLKSVRVATVDNFQGEEARVIVISLVRSNPQNKCGFLSTSNRINVLLSRARHGMYIIGNSNTCRGVAMWSDVISMLKSNGQLGTSLELQCARHPNTPLTVSKPDHFLQYSPESGCNLPCDKRLGCGHGCGGRCHSDVLHNAVKCLENCPRSKQGCDHPCPLRCGDPCQDRCHVLLKDINLLLPCGHRLSSARCWEAQDPASIRCKVQVSRTVPGCNHEVNVPCYQAVASPAYRCATKCGQHLSCGHTCKRECCVCNTREDSKITNRDHGICEQKCDRNYTICRHACSETCHGEKQCPPCNEPCEVRCSHSRCGKPCHEPCAPCAEEICASGCPHTRCAMPCAAPCDRVPCSRRCEKMLKCGHRCPSVCGEICPPSKYCQQCGSDKIKSTCVDFLEMKEYHEIDLNEEPCIFPKCGHFLTVSSMDGQMDIASHYGLDENGLPTKISRQSEPFSMDSSGMRVCATCRASLQSISRYGRIARRVMLDEVTKKFVSWSNARYLSLAENLVKEQAKLEETSVTSRVTKQPVAPSTSITLRGSRPKQLQSMRQLAGNGRYKGIVRLWEDITAYAGQVRKEEQPFRRVADLVRHANRKHATELEFKYDESVIQVRGHLLAASLLLKCDLLILSDFIGLCRRTMPSVTKLKMDLTTPWLDCANLIKISQSAMHPREEVQGHIFSAQLCLLSLSQGSVTLVDTGAEAANAIADDDDDDDDDEAADHLSKEVALSHVDRARTLLAKYPSTTMFKEEIDAIENTLKDNTYQPVTSQELRAVYQAMAGEFRGTGHWYVCQNGHPFTVGACGRPMEQAKCTECDAPIGGHDHRPVEGVRHAVEVEQLARDVDEMEI